MITCTHCKTTTEPSEFVNHLLESNLKCFNAKYRQNLYTGRIVALSASVQKEGRNVDHFICLVCKECKELELYKDFIEERKKFEEFHKARCGSRFSEIERLVKPSAAELAEVQSILQHKKHPSCRLCGYDAGGNQSNLNRHIQTCKGPKDDKKECCEKCGYDGGGYPGNLKRHIANCKGPKDETSVVKKSCPHCGYDGNGYPGNLKRHIAACKGPKKPKDETQPAPSPPQNTVVFAEPEPVPQAQAEPPQAPESEDWVHKRLCEVKDYYEIDMDDEDYTDENVLDMLIRDVKKAEENTQKAVARQQSRCDTLSAQVSKRTDELFEVCCLIQSLRREDNPLVVKLAAPSTLAIVKDIIDDEEDLADIDDKRTQLEKMEDQLYDRDKTISILKYDIKKLKESMKEKDIILETYETLKIMKSNADSESELD